MAHAIGELSGRSRTGGAAAISWRVWCIPYAVVSPWLLYNASGDGAWAATDLLSSLLVRAPLLIKSGVFVVKNSTLSSFTEELTKSVQPWHKVGDVCELKELILGWQRSV